MSGAQLLEFQEACHVKRLTHDTLDECEELTAADYARRCATLLANNDLQGALWCADIAASAYAGIQRRQAHREIQPVVDEDPHAADVGRRLRA